MGKNHLFTVIQLHAKGRSLCYSQASAVSSVRAEVCGAVL